MYLSERASELSKNWEEHMKSLIITEIWRCVVDFPPFIFLKMDFCCLILILISSHFEDIDRCWTRVTFTGDSTSAKPLGMFSANPANVFVILLYPFSLE
jgi:hypothetical protein